MPSSPRRPPRRRWFTALAVVLGLALVAAVLGMFSFHWGVFTVAGNSGVQQTETPNTPDTPSGSARDLPHFWIGTGGGTTWLLTWTARGSSLSGALTRACGARQQIQGEISRSSVRFTGIAAGSVTAVISSGDLVFSAATSSPLTVSSPATFLPGTETQWKAVDPCS